MNAYWKIGIQRRGWGIGSTTENGKMTGSVIIK